MKWWLYIALKQLFPTGRVASFFAGVSVLGVALGVLGLFGTQSVMNGFHSQIGEKLRVQRGEENGFYYFRTVRSDGKVNSEAQIELCDIEF